MFYYFCKTIPNGKLTVRALPPIHRLGFEQNSSLSLKYISSTTTSEQPFAVSYLIKTLGFSPEAALSASKYVHFETPEKADIVSEAKTIESIKRFMGVLKCNVETLVAPNINTLRENGVPESNIVTLLQNQPRTFMVNPVRFRETVEEVKEMGFNPSRWKFALAVFALRAMSKSTWERKVDVYKKWGLSENDIFLAFGRHPWCMMASEDKIMRVMDFLFNKMGMDSSLFVKRPGLVSLSLEKRLIPRGFVFQGLLSKGLVKKDFNMYLLFECPERIFVQKYIMPHKEEASELLKLYKEKMDSAK
ncbi:hypothetical protein CMV_007754 [Castanea mollissima]|uniref:Uncharacterized protein n=1 Tax=Castanea mollissima TaxID=60419 RepID=A0A8J4RSZ9_9ROSI|nr:hypothetical protein CMV_007754 [Castanea mollissima]